MLSAEVSGKGPHLAYEGTVAATGHPFTAGLCYCHSGVPQHS